MKKKVLVGVDWGGTFIKVGVFSRKGKLLRKNRFVSSHLKEKKYFVERLCGFVKEVSPTYDVCGVGGGCPKEEYVERGLRLRSLE